MSARTILAVASLMAAIAVGAGAFGVHALKARVSADLLGVWQTAVLYHTVHALALFLAGLLLLVRPEATLVRIASYLFIVGTVLFSGSLYALTLSGVRWLGAVTPVGGLAMIAGWIVLAWAAWNAR